MTVTKAPVRQQSYLTEWDRQMAEYLRQMGGSIGPQDIASEAYGGKFPVGTMTAKILSGVLAGASDKRAMNREERAKDFYGRAREIANAMDNPQLSRDGSTMSINPETGNFQYIPTYIPKGEQTTSTWGVEDFKNEYEKRITAMDNFTSGNLSPEQEKEARIAYESQGPLPETFEASPYSPTGIPYALKDLPPKDITEDMRYTVGEKAPEDSTQLGRYLSGTLPQDVLPINAEKALSQALRGANVPEFQFDEYRQNKRIQDRTLELAEEARLRDLQPQVERTVIYNKEGGMETAYKRTNPVNGRTSFSQEPNANVPFGPEYTIEPPKEIKQATTKAVLNTVTNEIEFATEKEITESKNTLVPLPKEESETDYDKKYNIFLNSEIERNSKLPDDKKLSITEIERIATTLASTTRNQEVPLESSDDFVLQKDILPIGETLWEISNRKDVLGIIPAVERKLEGVAGAFGYAGTASPEQLEAFNRLNLFKQELIRTLSLNPRFPIAEQRRILGDIDITAGIFKSTRELQASLTSLETKLTETRDKLISENKSKNISNDQKQINLRTISDLSNFITKIGIPKKNDNKISTNKKYKDISTEELYRMLENK